jgi:hypothetical protein
MDYYSQRKYLYNQQHIHFLEVIVPKVKVLKVIVCEVTVTDVKVPKVIVPKVIVSEVNVPKVITPEVNVTYGFRIESHVHP